MPVAPLTPYVPDPIYSEDHTEEVRHILHGLEKILKSEMTPREKWLFDRSPHQNVIKLTDWSGVLDLTDVTLSRYSRGHSDPPLTVVHLLRMLFNKVRKDPRKGVDALVDYLNRAEGPTLEERVVGNVVEAVPSEVEHLVTNLPRKKVA